MEIKSSQNWYVLQVITGKEQKIKDLILKLNLNSLSAFLPQKKLKIKKKRVLRDSTTPLYPGYIFIVGEWNTVEAKEILKNSGAIKYVGGINTPGVLQDEEKTIIIKITKGGVAGYSKVIKVGSKIEIISGPLKELKGVIDSVDRRKQRAIVKLPLLNSTLDR